MRTGLNNDQFEQFGLQFSMDELNGQMSSTVGKSQCSKTGDNNNFSYYHEYCRLYLANVVLTSQMKELMNERAELILKTTKLEKKTEQIENGAGSSDDRRKRKRRTAGEIQRHYQCVVVTCQKSYGSEGSLNQHIKLKHFEVYETMPQIHSRCKSECSEEECVSSSIQPPRRKRC